MPDQVVYRLFRIGYCPIFTTVRAVFRRAFRLMEFANVDIQAPAMERLCHGSRIVVYRTLTHGFCTWLAA